MPYFFPNGHSRRQHVLSEIHSNNNEILRSLIAYKTKRIAIFRKTRFPHRVGFKTFVELRYRLKVFLWYGDAFMYQPAKYPCLVTNALTNTGTDSKENRS